MNGPMNGQVKLDPIALAVLQHFVTPSLQEFAAARPDASPVDRSAAASLMMSVGLIFVRMARLKSGLDTARQLPGTAGTFPREYEFLSTPKDTPEARAAVAEELSSGSSSGPSSGPSSKSSPSSSSGPSPGSSSSSSSDAQASSSEPARDVSERWPGYL